MGSNFTKDDDLDKDLTCKIDNLFNHLPHGEKNTNI